MQYYLDVNILIGVKLLVELFLFLSSIGVKQIIYSGKLGTLNSSYVPNEIIATGNVSLLPNGEIVT